MQLLSTYLNYREFLRDWIVFRKSEGLPGSNRWFAQKMGINSSSWLTSILNGKRNLNDATIEQIVKVLRLSAYDGSLFVALVKFNQTRDNEEAKRYFLQLKKVQNRSKVTIVTGQFYDYYRNWYNSAIRAYIGLHNFRDTYKELGETLIPPVSERRVEESVTLLEQVGLISRNSEGVCELTSAGITTGKYERSVAIRGFQEETLQLGKAALHRFDTNEKDISTLTLGISREKITEVKDILAETRKKIAAVAEADDGADSVFQLNIQLFPLSQKAVE